MRTIPHFVLILATISGCSTSATFSSLNPFPGSASESPAPAEPVRKDPVPIVESLELGQAHRGVIATATGLADLAGFFSPELRLLNDGRPAADGMIELAFVARPPEAATMAADPAARRLVAALYIPAELMAAAKGVRVVGGSNAVARPF